LGLLARVSFWGVVIEYFKMKRTKCKQPYDLIIKNINYVFVI
jgi:hypothetical protein